MGNREVRNDRCCFDWHKPESNECRTGETYGDNQKQKETGVDSHRITVIVKAADYTKVTEALALMPEDIGRYYEERSGFVESKRCGKRGPCHQLNNRKP